MSNKITEWSKTWTIPQVIGVSVGMACITAMCIVITLQNDWGKLITWLAQPEAMTLLGGIVTLAITLYNRARGLPPPAALVLLFLSASLVGCGASVPAVVVGVEEGAKWSCLGAQKVCQWTDEVPVDAGVDAGVSLEPSFHDKACAVVDEVCQGVSLVTGK
jgi:hypothetical protein